MTAVMILNLLHVLTGFLLVSGIVGRGLALRDAARADEIHTVAALVRLGGRFEALVRAPSIALLALGLLAAWRGGWPILGFLQGGSANWILVSLDEVHGDHGVDDRREPDVTAVRPGLGRPPPPSGRRRPRASASPTALGTAGSAGPGGDRSPGRGSCRARRSSRPGALTGFVTSG